MKTSEIRDVLAAIDRREPVARVVDMASGDARLVRPAELGVDGPLAEALEKAFGSGRSRTVEGTDSETFIDVHMPPLRLVLIGAVHIAQALIPIAQSAGYAVTVIDPRTAFATRDRFPGVALDTRWPDKALAELALDQWTAFCALTHDPKIDEPGLARAVTSDAFYIGALGSKRTHEKRRQRLRDLGVEDAAIERIHAPIGLDIGAVGAAEIAIAIMAEITYTLRRREAGR